MDEAYPAVIALPPLRSRPRKALYFQRIVGGFGTDGRLELCVTNWQGDPDQTVSTLAKDGTSQPWDRREEGDLLVFRPPFDWDRTGLMCWRYDPRRQVTERMDDGQAERMAVNNRVSA